MQILIKNETIIKFTKFRSFEKRKLSPAYVPLDYDYAIELNGYFIYTSKNEAEWNKLFEKLSDIIFNAFNNNTEKLFIDINSILGELE